VKRYKLNLSTRLVGTLNIEAESKEEALEKANVRSDNSNIEWLNHDQAAEITGVDCLGEATIREYTFTVKRQLQGQCEVEAANEDEARRKLDSIMEHSDGDIEWDDDGYDIEDVEIEEWEADEE